MEWNCPTFRGTFIKERQPMCQELFMKLGDLLLCPRHCSEIDMENKSHLMLQKALVLTLVKGLQFLFKKRSVCAIRVEGFQVFFEDTPGWWKARWARATRRLATSDNCKKWNRKDGLSGPVGDCQRNGS